MHKAQPEMGRYCSPDDCHLGCIGVAAPHASVHLQHWNITAECCTDRSDVPDVCSPASVASIGQVTGGHTILK